MGKKWEKRTFVNTQIIMKYYFLSLLLLTINISAYSFNQQDAEKISHFIINKSSIKEGGTDLFKYNSDTYIISVSSVVVNSKSESDCKKVGATKAKKEMLSYLNGSEITSFTELTISETIEDSLDCKKVSVKQDYVEVVREKVMGTINQTVPLSSWYSDDKTVFYYAIYKIVE